MNAVFEPIVTLHSIQVDIDVTPAVRAVALPHTARHDTDYLIKSLLTEALGGPVLRPWVVHSQNGSLVSVLGYSKVSAEQIEKRLGTAVPALRAAVGAVYGHRLPELQQGDQFRFSVRLCPTIRVTPGKNGVNRHHGEQDAWLVAVERGETGINREIIYTRYLAERLPGAHINRTRMTRFRLERMSRRHRGVGASESGFAQRVVPDAVLEGLLTVVDPQALTAALTSGVGRQRAYGRGYIRLHPARHAPAGSDR